MFAVHARAYEARVSNQVFEFDVTLENHTGVI